jgi:hypothetical protein
MGRQSSAKGPGSSKPTRNEPSSSRSPLLIGLIIVAVIGIGAYAMWGRSSTAATADTSAAAAGSQGASGAPEATPAQIAAAAKAASYGPRKQAALPPIPFAGYEPPYGREVATQAFVFAAEHPEIASYVPCYCGCQAMGHSGNEDCFVKARSESGDVTEWEPHGVECAVCIEVATRSRQMQASGAGVTSIRTAVEREFNAKYPTAPKMIVPKPAAPAASSN